MSFKRKPPPGNSRRVHSNGQSLCGVITNKANRTVQFESFTERSLLLRLDRAADVRDYASQPERICYTDKTGQPHTYTPDFQVWHTDDRISLQEVTLKQRLANPQLQQRHEIAAQVCQARGWQFILHTEETLPQGSELANLLALWPYRPTIYDQPSLYPLLFETPAVRDHPCLRDLTTYLASRSGLSLPHVAACLYHLLWHDRLGMDWHTLLFDEAAPQPAATVWLPPSGGAQ